MLYTTSTMHNTENHHTQYSQSSVLAFIGCTIQTNIFYFACSQWCMPKLTCRDHVSLHNLLHISTKYFYRLNAVVELENSFVDATHEQMSGIKMLEVTYPSQWEFLTWFSGLTYLHTLMQIYSNALTAISWFHAIAQITMGHYLYF